MKKLMRSVDLGNEVSAFDAGSYQLLACVFGRPARIIVNRSVPGFTRDLSLLSAAPVHRYLDTYYHHYSVVSWICTPSSSGPRISQTCQVSISQGLRVWLYTVRQQRPQGAAVCTEECDLCVFLPLSPGHQLSLRSVIHSDSLFSAAVEEQTIFYHVSCLYTRYGHLCYALVLLEGYLVTLHSTRFKSLKSKTHRKVQDQEWYRYFDSLFSTSYAA